MKFKSDRMTVASGSINGTTFSHNRGTMYTRSRTTPVNPQSPRQVTIRNSFGENSQAWRNLSQAQRDAWNDSAPNFKITNVFGDQMQLSGSQLFVRLNNNLLLVGASRILEPPAPESPSPILSITGTLSSSGDSYEVTLGAIPATDNYALIQATVGLSQGKSFVKNLYRITKVVNAAATNPIDITSFYKNVFGLLAPVGTKVGLAAYVINGNSGVNSTQVTNFATAV